MKNKITMKIIRQEPLQGIRWIRILGLFFLLFVNFVDGEPRISVISSNPNSVQISVTFDEPLDLSGSNQNGTHRQIFIQTSGYRIILLCENALINTQTIRKHVRQKSINAQTTVGTDLALNGEDWEILKNQESSSKIGTIEKQKLGSYQGKSVYQLQFFPASQPANQPYITWIDEWVVQIEGQGIQLISEESIQKEIYRTILQKERTDGLQKRVPSEIDSYTSLNMDRLKIWVSEEGIYIITQPMLLSVGWDISAIDPRYLRMVSIEGEIPIRIIGEEDGSLNVTDVIEFWGEPLTNSLKSETCFDVYATQNIYWLELGSRLGLRLGQEEGGYSQRGSISGRSYLFKEHFEKNNRFSRFPYAQGLEDNDLWFYGNSIAGGEQRNLGFPVYSPDNYTTQMALIKMKLRGHVGDRSQSVQHSIQLFLNNRFIGSGSWKGNTSVILESDPISPIFFSTDTNIVTIQNGSMDGQLANLFIDWFEVTYPRLYEANNNIIRFTAPRNTLNKMCYFKIENFTDKKIEIYKKGISRIVGGEVTAITDTLGQTTYTLYFQDHISSESTEYIALTPAQKCLPDSRISVKPSLLKKEGIGADYIAIVPSDSLGREELEDLIKLREEQGLKVAVVRLDSIYDAFYYGIPHALGIQKFLRYALLNWSPQPRFVLLVGDGLYNNRGSLEDGNICPVVHFQTLKYGAAASDYWYSLLVGDDDFADIAIGRLPVGNRSELKAVVDKIVDYENSKGESWKNSYLLIGSAGDGDIFRIQSENMIQEFFPHSLEPKRLYLSGSLTDPYVGGTEDLMRHFQEGVALINFRGHGGGRIWADAGLLNLDDIPLIENSGKLPVISSLTCFTADFASGQQCLGEAMVLQEENGAIAFWGATGVGWVLADYYLFQELLRILSVNPALTLGEMINEAKANFLISYMGDPYHKRSEIYQFVLLGDPAIRFAFPSKEVPFSLQHRSFSGEELLEIDGMSEADQYTIELGLTNPDYSNLYSLQLDFNQRHFQATLPLYSLPSSSDAGVRLYVWDEQSDYEGHGFIPFSVNRPFIDSLKTVPLEPTQHDSVFVSILLDDPSGIQQVWCHLIQPHHDSLRMEPIDTLRYQTQKSFGLFRPKNLISYAVSVQNGNGEWFFSDTVQYAIPTIPELTISSIDLEGKNEVMLYAMIQNLGGEDVKSVEVLFSDLGSQFMARDTIQIDGYSEVKVSVPFSPPLGEVMVNVMINPDSLIEEKNYENNRVIHIINSKIFNITPLQGSFGYTESSGWVGLPGKVLCSIPSQAVNEKTVIQFEIIGNEEEQEKDSHFHQSETIYRLSLPGLENHFELFKEAQIQFIISQDSGGDWSIPQCYSWNEGINRWVIRASTAADSQITITTKTMGYFSLFKSNDHEPPNIEIQVQNQPFAVESYISRNPHITIHLQDESGIDLQPGKITVFFNETPYSQKEITFPDSIQDPTNCLITLRPELIPGEYNISAEASDVHGNHQKIEPIYFLVASEFAVRYLGNYPNPFPRETVIAYELTSEAEKFSIKIYTVSGKLVRVFDEYSYRTPGYHEILWDGEDVWGDEVANGVYFLRLLAKTKSKRIEITEKVAKLR